MKKSVLYSIFGAAILIILAVGGYMVMRGGAPQESGSSTAPPKQTSNDNTDNSAGSQDGATLTINFTDSGFEKTEYEVKRGAKVTVKNNSDMQLQFSSDDHPVHTDNPELNMTLLQPGESATLVPDTVGDWGVHDHLNPQYSTTLHVTE